MKSKLVFSCFLLIASFSLSLSLKVSSPSSQSMPTQLKNTSMENVSYMKRTKERKFSLTFEYDVDEIDVNAAYKLTWARDEVPVTVTIVNSAEDKPTLDSFYAIRQKVSDKQLKFSLVIVSSVSKPGNYKLTVTQKDLSASGIAVVQSAPILDVFSKPKRVLQGDSLRLVCGVMGLPAPKSITWTFGHLALNQSEEADAQRQAYQSRTPVESSNSTILEAYEGIEGAVLRFTNLEDANNGFYVCKAVNSLGEDESIVFVNVKDRWAALWPFVGIVAEVIVLVAAILLYERHQMKPKAIADTLHEDQPVDKPTNNEDTKEAEDVRLRQNTKL